MRTLGEVLQLSKNDVDKMPWLHVPNLKAFVTAKREEYGEVAKGLAEYGVNYQHLVLVQRDYKKLQEIEGWISDKYADRRKYNFVRKKYSAGAVVQLM